MGRAKLVAFMNFKGGVGKSSFASMLASIFSDSFNKKTIILNIALGQPAEDVNEAETIDFADLLAEDDTITPSMVIGEIIEDYDYIFLDTPGELSDELIDVMNYIDYFVVPFERGKRVYIDTMICLDAVFGTNGIEKTDHVHNIFFIYNKYGSKDPVEALQSDYEKGLNELEVLEGVTFNVGHSSLSRSDAIATMEESQASVDTLSSKNRAAYKVVRRKVINVANDLVSYLE